MRPAAFLIALCLAGAVVAPLRGEPLPLDTRPVGLSAEDDGVTWVGALRYRGGLEIRSGDPRFGGLSGLLVEADGSRFRAVGDKGYWVTAALRYDRDGRLAGVTSGRIGALRSADGRSVAGTRRADAEALARTGRGLAVAFEGRHRISVYPISLTARPLPLATPDGLRRAPANGGIEALATLGDGRLLAISERFAIDGRHVRAWLRDRRGWHPLSYQRHGRFFPTGAATLPGGDVLVLERRFTWVGGIASRIVRIPAEQIQPDAVLRGRELAVLDAPLVVENFEAIAVRRGADGETLLYLLSDDNYHALQRTLLLMFALKP